MHHFNQLMETGQLINQFMRLWDSRGRVLVVPFQNVSLKGILVKFCPIFSALSVCGGRRECNEKTDHKANQKGIWICSDEGGQDTSEQFTQVRFAFVKRSFSIFVADAHLSPISHEILRKAEDFRVFTLMGTTCKTR